MLRLLLIRLSPDLPMTDPCCPAQVWRRTTRVAERRGRDDTTEASLLLFAAIWSEPPRRGLPRPGAAGAAQSQGVRPFAGRCGSHAATRRALRGRRRTRDPRTRGRPRGAQGRGPCERRAHPRCARPLVALTLNLKLAELSPGS